MSETKEEIEWRTGKKFLQHYHNNFVAASQIIDIAFVVGKNNVKIDEVKIFGSTSQVKWSYYTNCKIVEDASKKIEEIRLNQNVLSKSDTSLYINPVVVDYGNVVFDSIYSIGFQANDFIHKLDEKILTGHKFALSSEEVNILRIFNQYQIPGALTSIGINIFLTLM